MAAGMARPEESGNKRVTDPQRRNRERQVIDAAVEVFWSKGYSAASVQEVADLVGVQKGSLYHYISSKEELLFRIFEGSHEAAIRLMEDVRALDCGPVGRLREYLVRYIVNYVENFKVVGLYYREWRFIEGDGALKLRQRRRMYDTFISDLLTEALHEGEIPAEIDTKLATYFVMAAINGIADWYRPGGALSAREIAEWYADAALNSVGATSPGDVPAT
jgi:AcrR family transcriptional regulator